MINNYIQEVLYTRIQGEGSIGLEIESKMQELVQLVLCDSHDDLDRDLKFTFLAVAKTYYYMAYFDDETINSHIDKVLFDNIF